MRKAFLRAVRRVVLAAARRRARRFRQSLQDPRRAQELVLSRALADLARTRYGARYGVRSKDDYAAFSAKLPVAAYDSLAPWVADQRRFESRALCAEPVRFYEPSSGSSGPSKLVPYTPQLLKSYQHLFLLWLGDLLERGPRLETGRTWLSVSPIAREELETEHGVKIGLDDDTQYLTGWLGRLLSPFWVVPAAVRRLRDARDFRFAVSERLLAAEDLEVVSIWNPSLLRSFMDFMRAEKGALLRSPLLPAARRELLLRELSKPDTDWTAVWPRLKLVSCWSMAGARDGALDLERRFGRAVVQGKGHLSTESPVTFPSIEHGGYVPLLDRVFFEFLTPGGAARRLHEIVEGVEYELVVTPLGGLPRYRLGDRVRVSGRAGSTPMLELVGRADDVCDMVGEKLSAKFVADALAEVGGGGFRTLLPVRSEGGRGRYVLLAERAEDPAALAREIDEKVMRTFHYRNARVLGQLEEPRVAVSPRARDAYLDHFAAKGMKLGDIKHEALVKCPEDGAALARKVQ